MQGNFILSLNQAANLIINTGAHVTYLVEGNMGWGKTSTMKMFKQHYGEDAFNYITVDCTQLDVGDVQIPAVDNVDGVTRYLPNEMFVGTNDKPMFICFDELGKASRPVQNACLPIMLERRVGNRKLHPDSRVFATTNLGAEGVGDTLQSHARDRMSILEVRKPTGEEWIGWGLNNNINPALLAFANETEQLFQDFRDVKSPSDNPYIFHPKEQRSKFVTGRGLEFASHILNAREKTQDELATQAAIAGVIGPRAAADLVAYVTLADKLPSYASIQADPMHARLPVDSPAAMCMTVWNCVAKVTMDDFENVLQYVCRLPLEIQSMYATELVRMRSKQAMAVRNRKFSEWVAKNSWSLA